MVEEDGAVGSTGRLSGDRVAQDRLEAERGHSLEADCDGRGQADQQTSRARPGMQHKRLCPVGMSVYSREGEELARAPDIRQIHRFPLFRPARGRRLAGGSSRARFAE